MKRIERHAHKCAAFECRRNAPWNHLMCARHWELVPRDIQQAVNVAWNGGKRTPAWADAVKRAIASLERQSDLFEKPSEVAP